MPTPDAGASEAGVDAGRDAGRCEPDRARFATEVRPLIERYCGSCHGATPNYGARSTLLDLDALLAARPDGTRLSDQVAQRLAAGTMPPTGMPRAPQADAEAIAAWASCGAVSVSPSSGLVSTAPPLLAPATGPAGLETVSFRASNYVVGPAVRDDYRCFVFDAPVTEPKFIRRFEMVQDRTEVLHHVVLLRDVERRTALGDFNCYDGSGMPTGSQYLYAWAPGQNALEFPSGGLRMSPGERYIVQIHYNNGRSLPDVRDSSGVKMYLGPMQGPEYGMVALGPTNFALPARVRTRVTSRCTMRSRTTAFAGMPHMHLLGSEFSQSILRGGMGEPERFVRVTGWDFNTQLFYSLPATLDPGDVIETSCVFRNTTDRSVTSGEDTGDEMCFNFLYVTPPPEGRYCDEGAMDRPTDVRYTPSACLPAGTPTDVALVRGTWSRAAAPPALVQGTVPDGRWVLSAVNYFITNGNTPIGTINLDASYVLARGQVTTAGGTLSYDVSNDVVVLTDSGVRFGAPSHNAFAGPFAGVRSPETIRIACPSAGNVTIDWGVEGDELIVGFTSSDVPGQTLWPRYRFRRAP